jgi:hypothetical protein
VEIERDKKNVEKLKCNEKLTYRLHAHWSSSISCQAQKFLCNTSHINFSTQAHFGNLKNKLHNSCNGKKTTKCTKMKKKNYNETKQKVVWNKTITTLATKIEKEMAYERTMKKWERRMKSDKKWWKTCDEMKENCEKMKWNEERERCKEEKWKDTLNLNDLHLLLAFLDFIFWFPSFTPFSTLGLVIWPPYHSHQGFHPLTFSYWF